MDVELTTHRRRQEGLTLIEVLFAGFIMLTVALGIIPLITQSLDSNRSGRDSTILANYARGRFEEVTQWAFDHADLTVDAGTEKVVDEYYSDAAEQWVLGTYADSVTAGDDAQWTRTTTVTNWKLVAGVLTGPLDASAPQSSVHVKIVQVEVENHRPETFLAGGRTMTLQTYKVF